MSESNYNEDNSMLFVDAFQTLIERTLWTGWLTDEKPVSLILISRPESGKTQLIQKFKDNKGITFLTDVTAYGIIQKILPKIDFKQPLNHILIPDLLNPLSKQTATSRGFIQFMNSLIEEGVLEIQTYAVALPFQQRREGIKCGLITSITSGSFVKRRHKWVEIGFLSRLLPVSFSYTSRVSGEIIKSIVRSEYHNEESIILNFPEEKQQVKDNPVLYEQFIPYSIRLGQAQNIYGFRYQKQFQTLAKANALAEGRKEVMQTDIDWVCAVAEWINLDFKPIDIEDNKIL